VSVTYSHWTNHGVRYLLSLDQSRCLLLTFTGPPEVESHMLHTGVGHKAHMEEVVATGDDLDLVGEGPGPPAQTRAPGHSGGPAPHLHLIHPRLRLKPQPRLQAQQCTVMMRGRGGRGQSQWMMSGERGVYGEGYNEEGKGTLRGGGGRVYGGRGALTCICTCVPGGVSMVH
jgi:hypothetical protein